MNDIVTENCVYHYVLRRDYARFLYWVAVLLIMPGSVIAGMRLGPLALVSVSLGVFVFVLAWKLHPAHSKYPPHILVTRWYELTGRSAKEFPHKAFARLAMKKLAFEMLCSEAAEVTDAFLRQEAAYNKLEERKKAVPQAATWNQLPDAAKSLEKLENYAKGKDNWVKTRREDWVKLFDFFAKGQPDGIGIFPELVGKADEFRADPEKFRSKLFPQPIVIFGTASLNKD